VIQSATAWSERRVLVVAHDAVVTRFPSDPLRLTGRAHRMTEGEVRVHAVAVRRKALARSRI